MSDFSFVSSFRLLTWSRYRGHEDDAGSSHGQAKHSPRRDLKLHTILAHRVKKASDSIQITVHHGASQCTPVKGMVLEKQDTLTQHDISQRPNPPKAQDLPRITAFPCTKSHKFVPGLNQAERLHLTCYIATNRQGACSELLGHADLA